MADIIQLIYETGAVSLDNIWFPLLIWSACCTFALLILKLFKNLNPLFHYHLRTAALLSLPLGILTSFLLKMIPKWTSSPEMETAVFVIRNPINFVSAGSSQVIQQSSIWSDPNFFIGAVTWLIILISFILIWRFIIAFAGLQKLYRSLKLQTIKEHITYSDFSDIKIAFHNHPLVPFTFGWKQPVIVLPELISNEPEKIQMALHHELVHIRRGDYLLQLALTVIEAVFWFHPLIHWVNREIDTYREISCDQEVLSQTGFSVKAYASLLYDLIPLQSGAGILSVSMAVQNSTLKQRIKTMKNHKLYKTSFKQSLMFLLLMILGITLPIACSDLRGPESLSEEEMVNTKFEMVSPQIQINGVNIGKIKTARTGNANDGYLLMADEYGAFLFSASKFDGAVLKGEVSENDLTINLNNLKTKIISEAPILDGKSAHIWVRHFPDEKSVGVYLGQIPSSLLKGATDIESLLPPPPPAMPNMPTPPDTSNPPDAPNDFFVVVEEMPEPIGGIAAIQSKVQYPEMARRAGIEGRVTVQFIVNENGDVENAEVVRGIGGGCDEAALKVVREAKFKPGRQKGKPVRVRFALSINFRLSDADYSNANSSN